MGIVVAFLAGAALLCGCGADRPAAAEHRAAATATPDPAPTSTPRPAVDITAPATGHRVAAQPIAGARLRATVTVEGFAPPGSRVRVRSGCPDPTCARATTADGSGMWHLRVRLLASRTHPSATLRATCSVPGPPRRRLVRLKPAPRAAPRVHRAHVPAATPPPAAPAATPPPAATRIRRLVLIGDSLAEGIQPLLPSLLPGWTVRSDALTGRSLAAGMQLIAGADLTSRPTVLAVSLFTNDDPRFTAALAAAVQRSVALVGPRGCAVWATIVRPPYHGVSYAAANATLRRLAARDGGALLLVPWAEEVARHPGWIAPDHVHGTATGYAARAQMYARAAASCRR